MNILLIGPPGSGKGTQASIMSSKYGLKTISTGEILRNEINCGSLIGKEVEKFTSSGSLVPDEIVVKIVEQVINSEDSKKGFILDGFPRNLNQAEVLDVMLRGISKHNIIVLIFELSENVITQRLKKRIYCKSCGAVSSLDKVSSLRDKCLNCNSTEGYIVRNDDDPEIVVARIRTDKVNSAEMVDHYKKNKNTFIINADKSSQEISMQIESILTNFTN